MIIGDVVTVKIEEELRSGVIIEGWEAELIDPREKDFSTRRGMIYRVLVGDRKFIFTENSFL